MIEYFISKYIYNHKKDTPKKADQKNTGSIIGTGIADYTNIRSGYQKTKETNR